MAGNPCLLLFDADALIQLLCARLPTLLSSLRDNYGVHLCVMPEVDVEVESHRRRAVAAPLYEKARNKGLIRTLSPDLLREHAECLGDLLLNVGLEPLWNRIQTRGRRYNQFVDRGESYTHAAGVELRMPIVSNDTSALSVLSKRQEPKPRVVLRAFDLIVFAVQSGAISEGEANKVRGRLRSAGEGLPYAFRDASFQDGVADFRPRLADDSQALPEWNWNVQLDMKPSAQRRLPLPESDDGVGDA